MAALWQPTYHRKHRLLQGQEGGKGGQRGILPVLSIKELNFNFVSLIIQDIGVAGRTYPEKAF